MNSRGEQAPVSSNQAKLAGLLQGCAQQPPTPPPPGGSLPWEGKPSVPAPARPTESTPASAAQVDPAIASVTAPSDPVSTPMPATQVPPPGIYQALPGEMRRWDGSSWDPRPLANTWTRVWCWVIDNMLSSIVAFLAAILVTIPFYFALGEGDPTGPALSLVILVVAFVAYYAVSYRAWGCTPGMRLGGLRVVAISTGLKPGWGASWLRALVLCVSYVSGILALIWLVITSNSPARQGPHDRAARTVVVTIRSRP